MRKLLFAPKKLALASLLLSLIFTLSVTIATADNHLPEGCVIPESGPWPPCATGGNTASASTDDCTIPPSGPWPPCATDGNTAPAPPAQNTDDCIIPPSGPWPPCATGGNSAPSPTLGSSNDTCIIPKSGPWPSCATNGNATTVPSPAPGSDASPAPPYEIIDSIPIYYVSNSNELIGTFPIIRFRSELLVENMQFNQTMLHKMRNNLDSAASGDQASCDRYKDAYEAIKENGIFFADVPVEWEELYFTYFLTFVYSLDRTRPAYLSCIDSGRIDDFNRDLAHQTINETLDILNPAVDAAVELWNSQNR